MLIKPASAFANLDYEDSDPFAASCYAPSIVETIAEPLVTTATVEVH